MKRTANDRDFDSAESRRTHAGNKSTEPARITPAAAARIDAWLTEPLAPDVKLAVARLARAPDVQRIAVMPDVHLAECVCIGNVVATSRLIYPQAVGGDIGCGMTTVAFDASAGTIQCESNARALLAALPRIVPAMRWPSLAAAPPFSNDGNTSRAAQTNEQLPHCPRLGIPSESPDALNLSPGLRGELARLGRIEFGTLGRGNHFLELQTDDNGTCWALVHSGSRYMGQAITRYHMRNAIPASSGLHYLDADTNAGRAYLSDAVWAENFASANRRHILAAVANWMSVMLGAKAHWETLIDCSHNHIRGEIHSGKKYWVHRKGAMAAHAGQCGIIPGSMGTMSVHVTGRGESRSLCSSAHGAGRALSREAGRRRISAAALKDQMQHVWFAEELMDRFRDEAPAAYKDVRRVLRAQRQLVRVIRRLTPILVYKGA